MHTKKQKRIRVGPTGQKILLLLAGGVILSLTRSPKQYFRVIKTIRKDWQKINATKLNRAIRQLYRSRLVDARDNRDGTTTITLTQDGKARTFTYQINEMSIPAMKRWDKKWRLVLFDIPETRGKTRRALSHALLRLGFLQFQKSVFVHPFECRDEIDFVIEFFSLRPHVRTILAEHIDNELHLKNHFGLQ